MLSIQSTTAKKMTAQEKEAQIMSEIRSQSVKYESKYEGSFLGELFGISFKKST